MQELDDDWLDRLAAARVFTFWITLRSTTFTLGSTAGITSLQMGHARRPVLATFSMQLKQCV